MSSDSGRTKVLVVDDDRFVRQILQETLESEGYAVQTADNGQKVLDLLKDDEFEVVLTDMDMPQMDGLTLISRLKEVRPDLPVVVLSGTTDLDTVIEAMKRGASDYLVKDKDVSTTVILAAQKASGKYRMARQNRILSEQLKERNLALEKLNKENLLLLERLQHFNDELEQKVQETTAALRYRLAESNALNLVASAISSVMEVQPLLEMIMGKSKEVMSAEASSLMLLDETGRELVFNVATGEKGEALREVRLKVGLGIAGWVAQTGDPLLVPDAYQDSRFNRDVDKKTGFRTRSILCVPLKIQDRILGVVQVINSKEKESFDSEDLQTFTSFAHHAAIGIENARLYQEIRRKADELHQALERERWLTIQRDKLGMYVPKSVVEEIERGREHALAAPIRTVDCTILFSDIEGFTRIAETAPPRKLLDMLNKYHSAMNGIIEKHEGILDKFIGDGIMVVFLPKDERDNHALRAVRCGVDMQQETALMDQTWVGQGLGNLRVRIGINTGEVISGNIGAETRMDYTVIGDNVNVASRLESNARTGEVFIADSVYQRVKNFVKAVKFEPIPVKNRVQPVQPYSVTLVDP
ncbi:MAG: response regulator [Armatimonadetes bacterium]|nr:response regulator [Armatimonadota bacterium]